MRRTLTLDVTVETPADMTEHDVMDILRVHLGISSLDSIEADISSATIVKATPRRARPASPVLPESRGTADQPVILSEVPYRQWEQVDHGHSPTGRCVKNRFGNPSECTV